MNKEYQHSVAPVLSIVVPVYRSEHTLAELHRRLTEAMASAALDYELIFVEDCGGDGSWRVIEELAASDHRVRGIKLSRNFGQHAATICGFAHAGGEWVSTLDDDLEQAPENIPDLYKHITEENFDLVYGIYSERTHSRWRNVTSGIARWLFGKAIPSLNYSYTSFRMIRGNVARELTKFDSPFPFVDGYLSWLTNTYSTVEVPHGNRTHGRSTYTFSKLLTHTLNIFVTFSDLPLKLASWIGLVSFLIGMLWLAIIVVGRLTGIITVSGFASIIAAIILFGGIQLLILGVFGEYLGRINFKSSKKPLFIVARSTDRPLKD